YFIILLPLCQNTGKLDPVNSGKISAGDAAQFLKKSGLSDNTLGKIWDLADSERKGYLDKRGFFIALRLVASAQAGHDVSISSLSQTLAPPTFVSIKKNDVHT
uniref:EH domain-containing protein n=1 Tax=Hippocampus comes TaxID=109280 RepID=A0A3Q2XBU3_HIPCM